MVSVAKSRFFPFFILAKATVLAFHNLDNNCYLRIWHNVQHHTEVIAQQARQQPAQHVVVAAAIAATVVVVIVITVTVQVLPHPILHQAAAVGLAEAQGHVGRESARP